MTTRGTAYREAIEQEADSGNEDNHPLERLSVDGFVDLTYANMAILENKRHMSSWPPPNNTAVQDRTHTLMVEVSRAISRVQTSAPPSHHEVVGGGRGWGQKRGVLQVNDPLRIRAARK
jgi:hypothetical protein